MNTEYVADRQSKREAILVAAQTVFLRDGYDLASMEAIAQEADAAKQTVYNNFSGKESLFRAVIQARCAALNAALDRARLDAQDEPRRVLTAFGETILTVMLSRDAMAMKRLLQSEAQRHPQLAEIYYRQGPDTMVDRLAAYLREQTDQGRLAIRDPRIAAEQFVAMLPGHLRMRHLIGLAEPPNREERSRYVASAVGLFFDGTGS